MIRYLLDISLPQMTAARCDHPALARLKGRGPWTAVDGAGVCIQRGTADAWGPIKVGLGGVKYQLADPLPPLASVIKINDRGPIAWVDLPGIRLPVKLAAYAPVAVGLDGVPEGPADEYGMLGARLWDRLKGGDLPMLDPELLSFVRQALMSQTDLTAELCHAYGLITTDTIGAIFDAASGYDPKKADASGDGG
jgi:hypothetical protein